MAKGMVGGLLEIETVKFASCENFECNKISSMSKHDIPVSFGTLFCPSVWDDRERFLENVIPFLY